jgi:hypothetical protein
MGCNPLRADMGSFKPYRRDVAWADVQDAPIKPLLDRLDFTSGKSNWGYQLRFGLFAVSEIDFRMIAKAMQAKLPLRTLSAASSAP